MQAEREGAAELGALLVLALAVALVWLAPAGVGAQLEARARTDAELYRREASPFRWDFADPRARVGPLQGLQQDSGRGDALALTLTQSSGDFGLRLSGQRIDPAVLPTLRLDYRSDAPLRLRLRAAADLQPQTRPGAWIDLPARTDTMTQAAAEVGGLPIALGPTLPLLDGPIAQLRLEFEAEPGQRFSLRSAELLPPRCGPKPCIPPRLALPADASTRWLLAVRDEQLAAAPQLRVGADANEPLARAAAAVTALSPALAATLGALIALLAWAFARFRSGPTRASAALLVGAITPALLLSLGLPRFPPEPGDALLLAGWALALLALWPRERTSMHATAEVPQRSAPEFTAAETQDTQAPTVAETVERPDPQGDSASPELTRQTPSAAAAWLVASGFTVLAVVALAAWAWLEAPELRLDPRAFDAERLLRYAAWAALQQLWLARFALPHLRALGLGPWTLLLAGLLFAALHLPNLELMGLCFIGGCVWAWMAERYGRLLPQIASHAALGLATAALLPPELLRSLEVGGRYVFAPL